MNNKIENKDIDDLKDESEDINNKKELTLEEMVEGVPEESKEDLKERIMKKVNKNKSSSDIKLNQHPLSDQQKYLDNYLNENRPIGTDEAEIEVIEATTERLKQEKFRTYNLYIKVGENRSKIIERVITDNNNLPIFDENGNVIKEKVYKPIMEKYVVRRPTLSEEVDTTKYGMTSKEAMQFMSSEEKDEKYNEVRKDLCTYISNVIVEPELEVDDLLEMTSSKVAELFNKTMALQQISDENTLVDFITGY